MTKISNQYSLTNVLFADAVNGRVGIGTSTPVYELTVLPTPGASAFDGINVTTGSADVVGLYRTGSSYSYGMVGANQSWIYSSFGDLNILTDGSSTNIKFGTSGGTERMRITSAGNVGIGTASPENITNQTSLSVNGTNASRLDFQILGTKNSGLVSTAAGLYLETSTTIPLVFITNNTERMRITSEGNVGIGTNSPFNTSGYTSFTINGTTGSIIEMLANGTRAMQIVSASSISYFYGALNTPMAWYTNANERMRITEGGDVCVATTSSSYSSANRGNITIGGGASALLAFQTGGVGRAYAYHDGSNYSIVNNASGGGIYMSSNSGGVVLSSGATSWASSSDERLKNINSNIEDAVSKLSSLRAVNFSWKSDETQKEVLGLIAQDVEKVFPQVVDKGKLSSNIDEQQIDETEYLGVRYTELVPVLVKAIQEQQLQINELKALLNA